MKFKTLLTVALLVMITIGTSACDKRSQIEKDADKAADNIKKALK